MMKKKMVKMRLRFFNRKSLNLTSALKLRKEEKVSF
jgi:hypothetical protein